MSKGRASLFVSSSDAAKIDVSQVHEAAVKGLNTLSQYDERYVRVRLGLGLGLWVSVRMPFDDTYITNDFYDYNFIS